MSSQGGTIHARTRGLGRLGLGLAVAVAGLVALPERAAAAEGSVFAWGDNSLGQLGDGTSVDHLTASPANAPADVTAVETGRGHVLALRANGTVVTWGSNNFGQVGDGTVVDRRTPQQVSGLTDIVRVSTGHYHSLALRSDGTVWAWGYNALGQLGDGTVTNRRTPVQVTGLTDVIEIAGGRDMSYALRSDGTVWAWGQNTLGQLGDGTLTNRRTAVRVGSLTNVIEIAGGRDHGLALRSDGTVWAWGHNQYGQVGDGTVVNRTTPVPVGGLTGVAHVIGGAHHSMALRTDGTVWTWGRNQRGQLGDGTVTTRRTPVRVQSLTGVVSIGAGRDHGLAILADGTVRAWGFNDLGQLGDGTTIDRRTPVVVTGVSGAIEVGGGRDFSAVLVATSVDEDPPTTPGTPSGSSTTESSITISWAPSVDASSITYRVLRDGGGTPVGTTSSPSFTDTGLASGSEHTYRVQAVDAPGNESGLSDASAPITVLSPDVTPPSTPGQPSGTSASSSTIQLAWAAASDDRSTSILYWVQRDGNPAGQVSSSSTGTVSFTDTGLAPGSTHTYAVVAEDGAGNESDPSPVSDPIVVLSGPPVIFADDFSTGDFSGWTSVTRMTIDAASGGLAPPSARAQVANQSAFASRTLGGSFSTICASARINAASTGSSALALLRLRTAAGSNVIRVFAGATGGVLFVKSDVSGVQRSSNVGLGTGWHTVELCGTVGTSGTWSLYRDGIQIVNAWAANTGTAGIGRIDLGDTAAKTFTVNFDDVVVDQAPG